MCPVKIEPTQEQLQSEFGKLFAQGSSEVSFVPGQIVKGKVIAVQRDYVLVDIGFKSEGHVDINEFRTPTGELKVNVGDTIDVLLEEVENKHGHVLLSKERADGLKVWETLETLEKEDGIIEGTIVSKVKGGMVVDIGVKAFLPGSQLDLRPVRNMDDFIGMVGKFKIIKLNKRRGNVVLSRKAILEEERKTMRADTLANLSEGQVFDGVVKNIADYGVFVDLGGVDGLLHVTDISWGRVGHPTDFFKVGDHIRVVILKFDKENNKVSLGMKQLQQDPWLNVEDKFAVGSRVHGKVVSLTDYGAFVALTDGVEGLVHISEMSWTKKLKHPSKILSVGGEVDAIVLDIDLDNKRISLGLKQIQPNPWEDLENKYPIGSKVKGTIRNIADFGVFVDVGAEIDGMVHISDLDWVQNFESPAEAYSKNDEVEAVVLHIDPDKERFSLGLKQLKDDPWDVINKNYKEGYTGKGKLLKLSKAGAVVELEEGVEGLIPKSKVPKDLKEGEEIEIKVETLAPDERHFYLSVNSVKEPEPEPAAE
ncbi:MAG: 30S ribosomal protein S1 [Pseudomonadota bacterium]